MALDQSLRRAERANYIGMRVVRDPHPRFAFQFRRDAPATLARYSRDPRFVAIAGGVPATELQPIFAEWLERFKPLRLVGGGTVAEFDGVVRLDMNIDEAGFKSIAAEQRWTLPERLELRFSPPRNERPIDSDLARLVRIFPREDRRPAIVNDAALHGRIVLRDGCFRLAGIDHGAEPLVIFGRDTELTLDSEGYMVVGESNASGRRARIGERVIWGGPRKADERDTGVQALTAKCGAGPIVSVGEPISERQFRVRPWAIDSLANRRSISRQAAWDAMKACLLRAEQARSDRPFEDCDDPVISK